MTTTAPTPPELPPHVAASFAAKHPSLLNFLSCCPFEPGRNLNHALTEDLFFDYLHASGGDLDDKIASLAGLLTAPDRYRQHVFIHGFPGIGKTTFIRSFIRKYRSDYNAVYIDCASPSEPKQRTPPRLARPTSQQERSLLEQIVQELSGRTSEAAKLLCLLELTSEPQSPHCQAISEHLLDPELNALTPSALDALSMIWRRRNAYRKWVSPPLFDVLDRVRDADELRLLARDLIRRCSYTDLMHILLNGSVLTRSNRLPILVILDNLDKMELALTSRDVFDEILGFHGCASSVYDNPTVSPDPSLQFDRDVRFVYCMREANYHIARAHIVDRWADSMADVDVHLNHAWELFTTRTRAARLVFKDSPRVLDMIGRVDDLLRILIPHAQEDIHESEHPRELAVYGEYFRRVVAPMVNFDTRGIARLLVEAATDPATMTIPLRRKPTSEGGRWESRFRYGLGGALIHSISRWLQQRDFGQQLFSEKDLSGDTVAGSGHCSLVRMVLTVVLNQCNYRPSRHSVVGSENERCRLDELFSTLKVFYDPARVSRQLSMMFLFHTVNWVNLVSIENVAVTTDESLLEEAASFVAANSEAGLTQSNRSMRRPTTPARVSITAAGYVFLKDVLIHFEFYSAFAGNTRSLFSSGLIKGENGRYLFETIIDDTYDLVRRHCDLMTRFYSSHWRDTPDAYKRSELSFRYLGPVHEFERLGLVCKKDRGQFHSCRLINSMVNYVDCFRLLAVSSEFETEAERIVVNERLTESIRRFSELHMACQDPDSGRFHERHLRGIESIKSRGYSDFMTVIVDRRPVGVQ